MTEETTEVKEVVTDSKEDKSFVEVEEESTGRAIRWLPSGIISFDDFDAMEEAKQQALQVKNDASLFKGMIDNILELEPSEEMDKSQMIVDLATEFATRVQDNSLKEQTVTKEDHYKAVTEDDTLAKDSDFEGGCPHCEFGEKELLSKFDKCPYCWGEL